MFRLVVLTLDGRRFLGPLVEGDETTASAFNRDFGLAMVEGVLPDWLAGQVDPDDIQSWGVVPGPGYKVARKPRSGFVLADVAVWPDPDRGFVSTPASGPGSGGVVAFGETEREAVLNMARVLDAARGRSLQVETDLSGQELAALRTDPELMPGVRHYRVQLERGNRFSIEQIEAP